MAPLSRQSHAAAQLGGQGGHARLCLIIRSSNDTIGHSEERHAPKADGGFIAVTLHAHNYARSLVHVLCPAGGSLRGKLKLNRVLTTKKASSCNNFSSSGL